jgi:hypothetical protein
MRPVQRAWCSSNPSLRRVVADTLASREKGDCFDPVSASAWFDKTRTVLLLPEAPAVLKSLVPLITSPFVFTSKRGKPLTKTNHYALWNPVRAAFWHSLPEERRRQIVDLDSIG